MAVAAETPSVPASFANNFWGKGDAGVINLLERMHNAKVTCDELKSFYSARASIEEDYARKLLSLCRKPLGSQESGTLRTSLDVVRGEVEAMGKSHQNIGQQMRTELEEPLAAFAGAMKERRKIVQNGIEKLLKVKTQQTQQVNKTRDRYEQECLKIKGYLAQGHMVMGQEERKNKAKLEKTQINLATSNTEYENAIKMLEDTTGRWNRDWKAAADKFQDLEEERLDFTKSSLWSFANIASTVCVSDDSSCEKIRLALEKCEVEKDIISFIKEKGTGQEIPDPPKYINFCRGDVLDTPSEVSDDDNYSVAQFQRTINPAYRSSSPQPSTYESHHDPQSALARELGHFEDKNLPASREEPATPQKPLVDRSRQPHVEDVTPTRPLYDQQPQPQQPAPLREQPLLMQPPQPQPLQTQPKPRYEQPQPIQSQRPAQQERLPYEHFQPPQQRLQYDQSQHGPLASVPHDPYPMDGMTMLCRTGPSSDRGSNLSARPSSRDSQSDYSNPTSLSSQEPPSGKTSPIKQPQPIAAQPVVQPAAAPVGGPPAEKAVLKKKSGFFQNHSPFRRKSKHEKADSMSIASSGRNTWSSKPSSDSRRPQTAGETRSNNMILDRQVDDSPEPVDPRASFQLNIGNNVFDVATPDRKGKGIAAQSQEDLDPIAQALEELKGVTKQSVARTSADSHYGIATPAPGTLPPPRPGTSMTNNSALVAGKRGTPPPSYDVAPAQRLGAPEPAFTSKSMEQTRQKYVNQTQNMFSAGVRPESRAGGYGSAGRPESRVGGYGSSNGRPESRAGGFGSSAARSASRPGTRGNDAPRARSPAPQRSTSPRPTSQRFNSSSPKPFTTSSARNSPQTVPGSSHGYHRQGQGSQTDVTRTASPAVYQERPASRMTNGGRNDMSVQLAPAPGDNYSDYGGSMRGRASDRPLSLYGGTSGQGATRTRSKSVAAVAEIRQQFSRDGRPILHYARAMYMYQAAIPEELSFSKGDILSILRHQDDGWWEAEILGKNVRGGLVPSNYLQNC